MADRPGWLARAIDAFRSPAKPQPTVKPSNELDTVSQFVAGRPIPFEEWDMRTLMDEGYRRNVIVYVCINEIASSAAAPRYYLRDRKTQQEVESHELLDLFARPAPGLSWYELIETLLIHQQSVGTGYLHKGRNGGGQVIQLRTARPDRLQPVPDTQGNVLYYEYRLEAQRPQRVETEDLAPFRLPDPANDFHGLSPLAVAGIYGDIDAAAANYLRDFFANGAMPMGVLKFKTPSVRREDRLRVQTEWEETYGGGSVNPKAGSRWHNVGVIGADVEYQAIASEPAQLRLDAVWGMTESRLCATFGVPPQLVQARIGLQYSTYSNMREARRSFWTETLSPIYRRLADGLTRNIVAEYDEELDFCFDIDSIPELQEDLNLRADRATKLFLSGIASFNEARLLSDLEEAKTDFYAFPGTVTMVPKEDVESAAYFEPKAPPPVPPPLLPAPPPPAPDGSATGEEDESEEDESEGDEEKQTSPVEGGRGLPFEVLGLGVVPEATDREVERAAAVLSRAFTEAVEGAVASSDPEGLDAAIGRGVWREAERYAAVEAFVGRYVPALDGHLRREVATAYALHYAHHGGRETHALKDIPKKWADRIVSRVKTETKVLDRQTRDVVRSEILRVLNGQSDGISASSIIGSIGISPRQSDTVARARARLLADGKLKGKALEKDLDKLRVKLLRERAETIALNETRRAHAIGQQLAWEQLFAEGKLAGGRRAWHKLWVAHPTERTCGECMDLDGQERPLNKTFEGDGDYNGPPEPHPHCACSLALVRADGSDEVVTPKGGVASVTMRGSSTAEKEATLRGVQRILSNALLPDGALAGLRSIEVVSDLGGSGDMVNAAWYTAWGKKKGALLVSGAARSNAVEALHEVGHHIHLARVNDKTADLWADLSRFGKNARVSAYARTNAGEHFAEAFQAYARGGKHRARLLKLEPEVHGFMEKLWAGPRYITREMSDAEVKLRYGGIKRDMARKMGKL